MDIVLSHVPGFRNTWRVEGEEGVQTAARSDAGMGSSGSKDCRLVLPRRPAMVGYG